MPFMLVTRPTFHAERSWLKAKAQLNMYVMFVTLATFHAERFPLKVDAVLQYIG